MIDDSHFLTHIPAHKSCKACRDGKTKEAAHPKGGYKRELSSFGDIITCDHLDLEVQSYDDTNTPNTDKALVIKDLYTGYADCIPVISMNAEGVEYAFVRFMGNQKPKKV